MTKQKIPLTGTVVERIELFKRNLKTGRLSTTPYQLVRVDNLHRPVVVHKNDLTFEGRLPTAEEREVFLMPGKTVLKPLPKDVLM